MTLLYTELHGLAEAKQQLAQGDSALTFTALLIVLVDPFSRVLVRVTRPN